MQSSVYEVDAYPQADGRRYVRETHVDAAGVTHAFEYLATAGTDYAAVMAARATQIDAALAEAEAQALMRGD